MADEKKFADEVMSDDELDGVAGGWFWPNNLSLKTYEAADIKVVEHFHGWNICIGKRKTKRR